MIFGPNPPMLAVQLMNPTAAAAAEALRNADGSAQNDGRYETVPKPISVNTTMSSAFECGRKNHALSASAAVNCGMAKCQRRSRVRSEFQPSSSIPIEARDERNRAYPANALNISPSGEPLEHGRHPKPEGVAAGIAEEQAGGEQQDRRMPERLPNRNVLHVCFGAAALRQGEQSSNRVR